MKIYAHRGASGYAPENTIEAFKLAVDMKADGIETDIHLTKDDVLVLIHDETINRTTNGKGYVKDYTYQELLEFDANNKMDHYTGCKIPTLEQLFNVVKDTPLVLQLEVKTDTIFYQDIEEKIISLVKKYKYQDRVYYSSFNHRTIKKIQKLDVNARVAFLYEGILVEPEQYTKQQGCFGIHPKHTSLQVENYVNDCHDAGLVVNVWTVNKEKMMKQCLELGVDGIFSNYPDKAMKLVGR